MDTVTGSFNQREAFNRGLFENVHKYFVGMRYVVHKINDNRVRQVLPDSPFYWWYERKVRRLFADINRDRRGVR